MILYHGTSDIHLDSINKNKFMQKTWFAVNVWHGFQLAIRTANRDGGNPIVLEVEICNVYRVIGKHKPSYRYEGGDYHILNILTISKEPF